MNAPLVYKFRVLRWIIVDLAAILALCVFLGAVAIARVQWGAVIVMALAVCLFVFLGALTLIGMSDIVIDDTAISRRLFGRTLQSINWDNVRVIRSFTITNYSRFKPMRAFKVFPIKKPAFRLYPPRTIWFNEQLVDIASLVQALNRQIAKHSIAVQVETSTGSASANRL